MQTRVLIFVCLLVETLGTLATSVDMITVTSDARESLDFCLVLAGSDLYAVAPLVR